MGRGRKITQIRIAFFLITPYYKVVCNRMKYQFSKLSFFFIQTAKKCSKKGEEDIDDCDEDFNAQLKEKTPQVENDFGKCTNIKTPHNCVQVNRKY